MKGILIFVIAILVILIGGYLLLGGSSSDVAGVGATVKDNSDSQNIKTQSVKTFTLTGENFKFIMNGVNNPEIRVKKGDKVRIEFTSVGGFHDWVVDEFNAATEKVNDGGVTSVEFIADKTGTFEYYCSVGQHRAMGMKGNLIVE